MSNINTMQTTQAENQWEAPVLYKEEWINTLGNGGAGTEDFDKTPAVS